MPIVTGSVIAHLASIREPEAGSDVPEASRVLVDWDVALELAKAHESEARDAIVKRILPVLVGHVDSRSYLSFFDLNSGRPIVSTIPDHVCVESKEVAERIIRGYGVMPGKEFYSRTVRDVFKMILRYQGCDLHRVSQYNNALASAGRGVFNLALELYQDTVKEVSAKLRRNTRSSVSSKDAGDGVMTKYDISKETQEEEEEEV